VQPTATPGPKRSQHTIVSKTVVPDRIAAGCGIAAFSPLCIKEQTFTQQTKKNKEG
jgi:hypothetical protein